MEQGDLCLVSLDSRIGHERRHRRAMLVVSPEPGSRLIKPLIVLSSTK